MTREELLSRISVDLKVCFGKPCAGATFEEVLGEYPGLEAEDIRACIAWGAEMSRERFIEIPLARAS